MMNRFRRRLFGDEESVRLCVLSAASGIPMRELRQLMPHVGLVNPDAVYFCWYQCTNALLEYREGSHVEALRLLTSVKSELFPAAVASAAAIRAMAHFQLGEHKSALANLEHAKELNKPREPVKLSNERGDWVQHLYARLLIDEAEALIKAQSGSPTVK
jgi:hypothetical protein